jgi:ribonuclease BN (tRNA processing enzyme)
VKLLFCGVRGSTPATGPEFVRVGGNTACVALAHDGAPWSLVLDAGTGLRRLTDHLDGGAFTGTLLLSHLHWDHVQGLPFFSAGDRDDARVRLLLPDQLGSTASEVLARAMSPPHFPIGPEGMRGDWRFDVMTPGEHRIEGFDVIAAEVPHKGGRTFGFRISDATGSVAYVPDHLPAPATCPELAGLLEGVDLLVHDAQFLSDERPVADDYGHSTVDDALRLAVAAGVRTLALFHHAPARTDDEVDAIGRAAAGPGIEVIVAREGEIVEIGEDAGAGAGTP